MDERDRIFYAFRFYSSLLLTIQIWVSHSTFHWNTCLNLLKWSPGTPFSRKCVVLNTVNPLGDVCDYWHFSSPPLPAPPRDFCDILPLTFSWIFHSLFNLLDFSLFLIFLHRSALKLIFLGSIETFFPILLNDSTWAILCSRVCPLLSICDKTNSWDLSSEFWVHVSHCPMEHFTKFSICMCL